MNILVFSGSDINGQGNLLKRYFSDYTEHKCTNAVRESTYHDFPFDTRLNDFNGHGSYEFFILRMLSPNEIFKKYARGVINKKNCIVRLHGAEVRGNPKAWFDLWMKTGLTFVTNGYDYSVPSKLGFSVQHIPPMVDVDYLWQLTRESKPPNFDPETNREHYVVAHAPTDTAQKGTHYLLKAAKSLNDKGVKIVVNLIQGKSWLETVKEKARAHSLFDQISHDIGIGTFGINLLEGLAQSKKVIGYYNKYTFSTYPDLQDVVYAVDINNLEERLNELVKTDNRVGYHHNQKGWNYVRARFDYKVVGNQWKNLLEFIAET
jgi:glycosyltransferase involved in cell wall biosynthesis